MTEIRLPGRCVTVGRSGVMRLWRSYAARSIAIYTAVSAITLWPITPFGSDRLTSSGIDVAPGVWSTGWMTHVIAHAINPFFTTVSNAPSGVNLEVNNIAPLLSLLGSPITALAGPIATYNFILRVCFVVSAAAMFYLARRFVRSSLAAFVAGLVYGFSPYIIGQGYDHVLLAFVPFPPLIFLVLHSFLARHTLSPRRAGLAIGLLSGAQFLIAPEVLSSTALLAAIGVVLLALCNRNLARREARNLGAALLWSLIPIALLAGFPAAYLVFGPQHLHGSPQPYEIGSFRSDLLGPLLPTVNQRFGANAWLMLGSRLSGGDFVENGIYLGAPLLLISILTTWMLRRRGIVIFASALAVVTFVICLGTPLTIDGHLTSIPLPFALLKHVPLLQDQAALRYSVLLWLFEALVIGAGLDALLSWARSWAVERGGHRRLRAAVAPYLVVAAISAFTLIPIVPKIPYTTVPAGVPTYFSDGEADAIAPGTVVLVYPYPMWPYTNSSIWQAVNDYRFKLLGTTANVPGNPVGAGEGTPTVLQPTEMQTLFANETYGENAGYLYGPTIGSGVLPPQDDATYRALRAFLANYGVSAIVVDPDLAPGAPTVTSYLQAALGASPLLEGGVEVWYHVPSLLGHFAP